ncbi:MAG: hypothetical protein ACOY35_01380 [Bacillota bacterium]
MDLVYIAGLFASLFWLNYQLIAPNELGTTTIAITGDKARRRIETFYLKGDGRHQISVTNKTMADLLKTTLFVGLFLSAIVVILTLKWLGMFSLVLTLPAFIAGMFITRNSLNLEFLAWQKDMRKGLSSLLEFMRAFLKLEGLTTKEALKQSVENIPNPLKKELEHTLQQISDTGNPRKAFDALAEKVRDRMFYAVCFRLGVGWDNRITPEMCDDLIEQIENDKDIEAAKTTVRKTGYFSLLCLLGMVIILITYGFPIIKLMGLKITLGGPQ